MDTMNAIAVVILGTPAIQSATHQIRVIPNVAAIPATPSAAVTRAIRIAAATPANAGASATESGDQAITPCFA